MISTYCYRPEAPTFELSAWRLTSSYCMAAALSRTICSCPRSSRRSPCAPCAVGQGPIFNHHAALLLLLLPTPMLPARSPLGRRSHIDESMPNCCDATCTSTSAFMDASLTARPSCLATFIMRPVICCEVGRLQAQRTCNVSRVPVCQPCTQHSPDPSCDKTMEQDIVSAT